MLRSVWDFAAFMIDEASGFLFFVAVLGLVFLTLYLPSLFVARLLFYLRRRRGPILRLLSYPIGPSIPGRGADGSALRRALGRWAVLGLVAVTLAIGSGFVALVNEVFSVAAEGWLTAVSLIAMGAALLASLVSGVECVCLLVRLALHRPRNPTSLTLRDDSESPNYRVKPPAGKTNEFTRVMGTHLSM